MKKFYLTNLIFLLVMFNLSSQNLLLEENFDYPVGTQLVGTNGWTQQGTTTTNPITVESGNLSYPSYVSSNIGNYVTINNSGQDAYKAFASQNSGTVYCAFLVNVSDAQTTGDYFFAFEPSPGNTTYTGRLFIQKDASSSNFAFGISKGTETAVYTNFDYSLNTTYLVVVKYEMIAGSQNDVISVFINPTLSSEPLSPTVSTTGGSTGDPSALEAILLRQGALTSAPTLKIDGIRVATTWNEAVKEASHEAEILSFTIPNQISSTINSLDATVDVVMPYGTDLTNLVPTITISAGATISPASGVAQDFTNSVVYTVTAEDGINVKNWTVSVTTESPTYITLVEWTFPNNPDDSIADGGISANLDKIITCTASGGVSYNASGATTMSARATGWDNGADSKYWRVDFTTAGYKDIILSSKQRSSSTGPRDFRIQYMINNDGNWLDVPNSGITCGDNWTSGVVNEMMLPAQCNNKQLVSIRWIMSSNTSVNGGTVASTGASRIDDIIVKGIEIPVFAEIIDNEEITIYPNPTIDILYINSNSSITKVNIITLEGKTISTKIENKSINISNLKSGIYIIDIETPSKSQRLYFVKQ